MIQRLLKLLGLKQHKKYKRCKCGKMAIVHLVYDGGCDLCDSCNFQMLAEGCD